MQRSRRALLQRRALEKAISRNRLYKLCLSLIIVLWGLVFLLNLWKNHGDGYGFRGASLPNSVNTSTWGGVKSASSSYVDFVAGHVIKQVYAEFSCQSSSAVAKSSEESREANIGKSGLDKNDRMAHVTNLAFDKYKAKEINSKSTYVGSSAGSDILRVEPGGSKFNYASSRKGAKVHDFNKECYGASHVLVRDKDKYLRNPCSVEEKFVVVELSEETLVCTIQIANFEHYSSNLKEFEVFGSLIYPTDAWVDLGSFTAANVKLAQTFSLAEPKSVRYLKLNLVSHYGSGFYCTLSSVEVYGVDAVEWMLEDLIAVPDKLHPSVEVVNYHKQFPLSEVRSSNRESTENDATHLLEKVNNHQQVSRMPGDCVLKILMQKVRGLSLSSSILGRHLEELNSRYRTIFNEFDEKMEAKDMVLERTRLDIASFLGSKNAIRKDVGDLLSWKSKASMQLDTIIKDNIDLRSEMRKVQEKLMFMESRGIAVFSISMILGIIALTVMCIHILLKICRSEKPINFFCTQSSWAFLLLSCIIIIIILSL